MADPNANDLKTRDMPPLSLRAAVRPGSVNVEKRTVDLVWTTGARVLRGFWERYYEELSLDPRHVRMERLNNGAPFLNSHDGYDARTVLGVVESARLEKGQGTAVVRFCKAEDDPEADKVFRKIVDGILANVSVGYRVHKMEKVEGGDEQIPVYRCVDWEPYEISVVPMGADDGAGFRSAESHKPNPCQILMQRKENTPMADPAVIPAAAPVAAPPPAAASAAPTSEDVRAANEAGAAEERSRVTAIRSLVAKHKLPADFESRLLGDEKTAGVPLEQARTLILEELAKRSDAMPPNANATHVPVVPGEDQREKFVRGAGAWLLQRAGVSSELERAAKAEPDRFKGLVLDPGEFRGMSLAELARESLERRGFSTRGMSRKEMIGHAFTYRSGMQTTSDFAVLFENVMHKTLLGAYVLQTDTWSRFCKKDTVPDFRPSARFRSGSFGALDSKNEHGEFKSKPIPDGQKTSISVGTKGNIIGLTREAIINDDMSALADLATKLGRAARLSIEVDVYALLTAGSGLGPNQADGQPFFHSNRANVNATGSAISTTGINADAAVMAAQKDISANEYLDLRPTILLVPYGLRAEAQVLNEAQFDPADNKFQKPNTVRGLFREVVATPRLTGTRRYLFADPSMAPAIVVAFLEGQGEAPVLESENGWRMDGVEWKVVIDYKAQLFDPKGAVTNAGA